MPGVIRVMERQATLLTLLAASVCWVVVIHQAAPVGSMGTGIVSLPSFVGTWVLMMAATMLPSALPFIRGYIALPGRNPWVIDGAVLVTVYLAGWAVFGLGAYYIYIAFGNARLPGSATLGLALCVVALYGLTPVRRHFAATCRSMCHDIEARRLLGAVGSGARYSVSCIGCSAGVMTVMLVLGMSSILWMAVAAALVMLYKVVPTTRWQDLPAAVTLLAFGVVAIAWPAAVPMVLMPSNGA